MFPIDGSVNFSGFEMVLSSHNRFSPLPSRNWDQKYPRFPNPGLL